MWYGRLVFFYRVDLKKPFQNYIYFWYSRFCPFYIYLLIHSILLTIHFGHIPFWAHSRFHFILKVFIGIDRFVKDLYGYIEVREICQVYIEFQIDFLFLNLFNGSNKFCSSNIKPPICLDMRCWSLKNKLQHEVGLKPNLSTQLNLYIKLYI